MAPRSIVIIGAGFSGTWSAIAARRLITSHLNQGGGLDIEVTLIAPEEKLVIRPRLYEADPASMSAPLGYLFRATGVKFIKGVVQFISSHEHEVVYLDPDQGTRSAVSYDKLIIAAGSHLQRPSGIPGLDEFAFDIDQIESATKLETHLKSLCTIQPSPARNTVVVCGGGFTGIELAAELPQRLQSLWGEGTDFRVILVDRGQELGIALGSNPRPVIAEALREIGVEVKLGATITGIDAGGIFLTTGERIETLTAVWTAGVAASELNEQIPSEKDKFGRLVVDDYLHTLSDKDIFGTGDAACAATDEKGHFAMMSCQHAIPLGMLSGHNAAADLLGQEQIMYRQPHHVTCLDLGSYGGVYCDSWDRKVVWKGAEVKQIKQSINSELIYPPKATPGEAFAGADPANSGLDFTEYFRNSMSLP